MERMRGVDAGFLYLETATQHMHTLKITIFEPDETLDFAHVSREVLARLHLLEPFRRRVLPVPWGLHHPLWIADREVDFAQHLFHHHVRSPGTMRELDDVLGDIASTPLDRSRPLWELHVCDGLAGGRVAVVAKIHHAVADGIAANALLANVTDGAATGPAPAVWQPEPVPAAWQLVRDALVDAVRQLGAVPGLLWRTTRAVAALVRYKRGSTVATPRPVLDSARVSFNGALTPARVFASCSLPLAEIKRVGKANGVTVNDVVLAVVSGALRSWLAARGERPSRSLIASVPVGTDLPGAPARLAGNNVSNLFTSLATDVSDPIERLHTISRVAKEAKVVQQTLGPTMLTDWWQFTPPAPFSAAMRAYSRLRLAGRHRAPSNIIVSNVPGPREPVTIAGTPLLDLYSVGPILEGLALNVTAWSYVDRMNFALLACPDLLPDLRSVVAGFNPALQELMHASEAST
jgi:diacylglycerol O-acyltransferase